MSLASRIIIRLALTSLIATGAAYGWLYVKQSRVDEYLRHLTLMQQAQEISRYVWTDCCHFRTRCRAVAGPHFGLFGP